MTSKRLRLFCYVDETGQDTRGGLFVVVTVIVGSDRETHRRLLQEIERASGKGMKKWAKVPRRQKRDYARRVVEASRLGVMLFHSKASRTKDYARFTLETVARAVREIAGENPAKVTVFIDGFIHSQWDRPRVLLSRYGVDAKVKGLSARNDEFIRLADAFAGLVRDHFEGEPEVRELYEAARRKGLLRPL